MRVQAVDVAGEGRTWTVLGDAGLPVAPIEEFLEHHRVLGSSPNTVRSYAKGLELWWSLLALENVGWEDPGVGTLRGFVTWLRMGVAPAVAVIALESTGATRPAETTVAARLAAVVSFYRFQHDLHGRGAARARASIRSLPADADASGGPPGQASEPACIARLDAGTAAGTDPGPGGGDP